MLKHHEKIKFSQLSIIFLGTTVCLWSTAWSYFGLLKSSYLFYFTVILISAIIFLFYFNFNELQRSIRILFILFFSINTIYFLIGILEYIFKGESISFILEYFIKQNVSIFFCLLFSQYLFNENNIDKFIKTVIYSYIIIFSVLIYVYVFIFGSDYIGTAIDLDFGRSRRNKNTFGIFIVLIFPFILTYILKSRSIFVGSIFFILYLFIISKIDSSTVVIVSLFQLALYFFIIFKKSYIRLFVIIIAIFIIYPNFIVKEFEKSSVNLTDAKSSTLLKKKDSDFLKEEMNQRPYIFLNSHRGWLFYSGLVKAKNDFFLGSGTQSFRIRDEIYDGKVRVRGRTETHNSLLSIFVDYGFLGLALYLFFYLFLYIKILKKKNLKITNYDISCIIYLSSLLLTFNFINIEYTLSIWLLNGICLSRALSK